MGWDRCSPEVERGLFAGADPQGSTEDFAAVEDGWAGAQGSTFLDRGWAVDPAGAAQGSTEAAGLAPARRISRKSSESRFPLESFPWRLTPLRSLYSQLILSINGSSSSAPGTLVTPSSCVTHSEQQRAAGDSEQGTGINNSPLWTWIQIPALPTRK